MEQYFDKYNKESTSVKTDLTIHCVCKNEPFIYYAIKSVYDYCDKILIYETMSTDKHTWNDICQLIAEDKDKKIVVQRIQLGFDEEKWDLDNLPGFIKSNMGKMSVGKVRQMQIDDTKTRYSMLVDGDEVHYKSSMNAILELLKNFPKDKIFVGLPLVWFYDLNRTFTAATFPVNGRVFINDAVYMNGESPNEQHLIKGTNEFFTYEHPKYHIMKDITPYAHFESVIRPWRRKHLVPAGNIQAFNGILPEVILENPSFLERFKNGTN